MASGFSKVLSNNILKHILGKESYSLPTQLFVGLFTVAPTADGGGTEVSGYNYSRATAVPANFVVTTNSATTNTALIFPVPSAGWGSIVAAGIFSAATGGSLLGWGTLASPITVNQDDPVKISAAGLVITLTVS